MTAFRKASRVLATTEEGSLWFECPGCAMAHRVTHGAGPEPRWGMEWRRQQADVYPVGAGALSLG